LAVLRPPLRRRSESPIGRVVIAPCRVRLAEDPHDPGSLSGQADPNAGRCTTSFFPEFYRGGLTTSPRIVWLGVGDFTSRVPWQEYVS
jgi:hypothetical protein